MTEQRNDGKTPELTDAGLDRLLDELKAPPPSDLLRARLNNAARAGGRMGAAGSPLAFRAGVKARLAAALALAALVGLAALLPAPGPAGVQRPVQFAAPEPEEPWTVAESVAEAADSAAEEGGADSGPALALVGGGDGAITGVGLVRAGWSSASAGDLADGDSELDEIPLD